MILIDLIYNLAVLVALSVLSGFINTRFRREELKGQILQGLLFGITAIIGMMYPYVYAKGVIFDGRSIVISLCTLFFGPISGIIASISGIVYRLYLGGTGTLTGVFVILASFLIGYYFYYRKNSSKEKIFSNLQLYLFGVIVNVVMLLLFIPLAYETKLELLYILTPTIIGIYPLATLLIGKILQDQERNQTYLEKLKESEERWQFALEGAGDGVWDWDVTTNKVYYSHRWKSMLGYKDSEIGDTLEDWEKLVHPEDKEIVFAELDKHFKNELPYYKSEHRILCKNGVYKWMLDRGKIISRNKNGEPVRVIGTHTDITNLKKITEELLHAKNKAEEMNRLKTIFFTNMSHELRTPLVGINGYAELLRDELDRDDLKYMAENIFTSGKRLSETLNLILDISKLEAEKMEFNLEEIDLVKVSTDIIKLYEGASGKKGINLYLATNEEKIIINFDLQALRVILNNLINNAIKFTNEGFVEVALSSENNHAEIKITDTGIGIMEKDFEIIFDEFRQANEGLNRKYEGTGLGLNITKKLVEKFKGNITVSSEIGKGTSFNVRIPIK